MRCKRRTCPSCGQLWAGDQRTRLLANLIEAHGGAVALLTITAPGRDELPYDEAGQLVRDVAEAWNRGAPAQWSRLHRAVRQRLARRGMPLPELLAYVWAYQRRGALHLHLVLSAELERDRIANRLYVRELKRGAAAEWGFGFVDLVNGRHGGRGLAAYLSKYVAKQRADGHSELAATVAHPDVPARPVYVANRLTARSRVTMRNLRLRRYYQRGGFSCGEAVGACGWVEDMWARGHLVTRGEHGGNRIVRGPPREGSRPRPSGGPVTTGQGSR